MLLPLQGGLGALGVEAEQQVQQRLHTQTARRLLLQQQLLQPLQTDLSRHPDPGQSPAAPAETPTTTPAAQSECNPPPRLRFLPSPAELSLLTAASSLAPGEHSRHFEPSGCRCVGVSPPVSVGPSC